MWTLSRSNKIIVFDKFYVRHARAQAYLFYYTTHAKVDKLSLIYTIPLNLYIICGGLGGMLKICVYMFAINHFQQNHKHNGK